MKKIFFGESCPLITGTQAGSVCNGCCFNKKTDQEKGNSYVECSYQAQQKETAASDPVNHPSHYTQHPSGVECIQITEHMNFCRGNAVKYIWRAGEKGDELEDLKKARWYIDREIKHLEALKK